jgi:hypothetical protein
MVLQILLREIDLGTFLKVSTRIIVLAIFALAAISLTIVIHTLGSSATSIMMYGCFSPSYWC